MSINMLQTRPLSFSTLRNLQKCYFATKSKDNVLGDIEVEEVPVYDVEPKYTMDEIENVRIKSRLYPQHHNILNEKPPFDEPQSYHHNMVGYRRRIFGRYGMNSALANPKYCWPTEEEVEDIKEYEKCLYPKTIQEIWKEIEEKKKEDALAIQKREEEIEKVLANMDTWRKAFQDKILKKEAEILAAKERKEAMLEEVREHFGFKIDTKDERFQEMLAQKEKEDKKRKKEERKKKKAEKMLARMAATIEQQNAKGEEINQAKPDVGKVEENEEKKRGYCRCK